MHKKQNATGSPAKEATEGDNLRAGDTNGTQGSVDIPLTYRFRSTATFIFYRY
jgi:hypothetical protein